MARGLVVAVRVKPGASRDRVGGSYHGPHGPALVVAVTAPAVDGRATEAARRALAEALGVRPAAVSLRTGAASRDKLFQVAGPETALAARLRELSGDAAAPEDAGAAKRAGSDPRAGGPARVTGQ